MKTSVVGDEQPEIHGLDAVPFGGEICIGNRAFLGVVTVAESGGNSARNDGGGSGGSGGTGRGGGEEATRSSQRRNQDGGAVRGEPDVLPLTHLFFFLQHSFISHLLF